MSTQPNSVSRSQVVLGFNAARGFASADRTSPAAAAQAGALVDVSLTKHKATELRIHGVAGSTGPEMLEHPQALQVAGDSVTGFYRRWSPDGPGRASVPWKVEAYTWGGLTEAPLASALWVLLAPFMMFNVAFFMLPWPRGGSHHGLHHRAARALLRLLALTATVQFASAAACVTISTVAWQAAGKSLPGWMGWYGTWSVGWRIALAMLAVAAIVGLLWFGSYTTTAKYEARTSSAVPVRCPRGRSRSRACGRARCLSAGSGNCTPRRPAPPSR
jgi:hypothetical protein